MVINRLEGAAAIVNVILILAVLLLMNRLPPVVPLFYGLPYGEEQLASKWSLIIPPIVALAFLGVNVFVTRTTKDDFIRQILTGLTVVTTALSTITVIRIILLIVQKNA